MLNLYNFILNATLISSIFQQDNTMDIVLRNIQHTNNYYY